MVIHNHPVGLCVSIDKDNTIVRIPKNASSLVSTFGKERNWLHSVKPKYFHILLRDPLERWISGVLEFYIRHSYNDNFILENLQKIEFDEHTTPQYKFLPLYGELFFYNIDNQGIDILQHKLNLYIGKTLPKMNTTNTHNVKLNFKHKLIEAIDESLVTNIKKYYVKDYALIKEHLL